MSGLVLGEMLLVLILVGLGRGGGCNGRTEGVGVDNAEFEGGQKGWYGKKLKGGGNGNGKKPGN